MRTKFTDQQEQNIVRQYEGGVGAPMLATLHECSKQTIVNILDRRGVERRSRKTWTRPDIQKHSPDMVLACIKRMLAGERQIDIARDVGIDQRALSKWWKASGGETLKVRGRVVLKEYVLVDCPNEYASMAIGRGYVLEHRLMMAQSIGRPLTPKETVHHINGNPHDNRLSNLQLRNGRHGKGACFRCADCGSHNVVATTIKD